MKHSVALLAAAGVGQVSATFGLFHNASPFKCPKNVDNTCDDFQKGGWSWGGLITGSFESYYGWDFKGWTCQNDFSKRDPLAKRTFGGKVIESTCGQDYGSAPSFGCSSGKCGSSKNIDSFSVTHFDLTVEFDCRLEFHYDMPDGSICKHSGDCSSQGTTIYNTQCGGAKKVRFVYPEQGKIKKTCNIGLHTINFDCEKPCDKCQKPTTTSAALPSTTPCNGANCPPCKGPNCGATTSPAVGTTSVPCTGPNCPPCKGPNCGVTTSPAVGTTSVPCTGPNCPPCKGPNCSATPSTPCKGENCVGTTTSAAATTTPCKGENCPPCEGPKCGSTTTSPCKGPECVGTTSVPSCEGPNCSGTGSVPAGTTSKPGKDTTVSSPLPTGTGSVPCEGSNCSGTGSVPAGTTTKPGKDTASSALPTGTGSVPCEGSNCSGTGSVPAGTTTKPGKDSTASSALPTGTGSVPCEGANCSGTASVPAGTTTKPGSQPGTTTVIDSTSVVITTFDSTSTIFTTSVHTITSCAPEVTNCPAKSGSVVLTTVTIPIDTTICPVTETHVIPASSGPATGPAPTGPANGGGSTGPANGGSTGPAPTGPANGGSTGPAPTGPAKSGASSAKPASSGPAQSNPATGGASTGPAPTGPANGGGSTGPVPSSTIVTTFDSTSTVFTTTVQTITSCAPEVPNCPAKSGSAVLTTVTIPVSTTICPVTETRVVPGTKSVPVTTGGSSPVTTGPSAPEESLPCPSVVPSCLNTFLYMVDQCKDNTDTACYCPSKDYVDAIFQCLYAHGESDDIISEAVSFFQGICAPYVGQNPGIATGAAPVTAIITVTGTPIVTSAQYTTVVVATTITEPCTTGGSTVNTVRTISTEITVPQVGFSTGASSNVVVAPTPAPTAPGAPATLLTSKPVPAGTGGKPAPTGTGSTPPTSQVPVVAGGSRFGMGFAAGIVALAMAL